MSAPIKVLHVVPSLSKVSGVTSVVYNLTRFSDSKRVHYDFLHHDTVDGNYIHSDGLDEEFESWGCAVYRVNNAGVDPIRFVSDVQDIMQKIGGSYDIVHCHMPNSAFCVLREAKKANIDFRILHSHLNTSSDKLSHRIRNAPLIAYGRTFANDLIACSQDAGKYLFRQRPFTILRNGIDFSKFSFDRKAREELRVEYSIPADSLVVGCVGRICEQKNFSFAVRVFKEIVRYEPSFRLVIVGDGETDAIRRLITELQVVDKVILTGARKDIERVYSLFDCLLMPSLCEGLPVAAVEAQATGLPCIYSDGVPRETDILGNGTFISLEDSLNMWVDVVRKQARIPRDDRAREKLEMAGYSASRNAELMMQHYESLVNENNGNK